MKTCTTGPGPDPLATSGWIRACWRCGTYLRENSLVNCSAASVPVLKVEKKRRRNKKKKEKKRNTTRKVGNNIDTCGDK